MPRESQYRRLPGRLPHLQVHSRGAPPAQLDFHARRQQDLARRLNRRRRHWRAFGRAGQCQADIKGIGAAAAIRGAVDQDVIAPAICQQRAVNPGRLAIGAELRLRDRVAAGVAQQQGERLASG